ncbi:MAG: hypothetical protein AAF242_08405, partial [Bacteroidota bacterium]
MTGGMVVVLGETGKNFAAGMSGGMAFVYNPEGIFDQKVNMEMVDLDPLSDDDFSMLKQMIHNHQAYTDSSVAKQILEAWDTEKEKFTKVMPRDFKRVLERRQQKFQLNVKPVLAVAS